MGLLSGTASISRFVIASRPGEPDFEARRFVEIDLASEVRERAGFLPMELEAPYQVGHSRFAFRVRIDQRRPDPTAVRERLQQLCHVEMQTSGLPFVGSRKRKELKHLAEEELLLRATPRSKIVEGAIDADVLYVATTAKTVLGTVLLLLREIGVVVEPHMPWSPEEAVLAQSEVLEIKEPGHSVLGCRFLRALLEDRELLVEPVTGNVRLATRDARVTLAGAVLPELLRYAEAGAEILSAKLTTGEISFKLDGPSFRYSGLKVEIGKHPHWTERLDERLEKISAAYELLDGKYRELDRPLRE